MCNKTSAYAILVSIKDGQEHSVHKTAQNEFIREAAKKVLFLVPRPLKGGGGKALVARPLKKELYFFAASLYQ